MSFSMTAQTSGSPSVCAKRATRSSTMRELRLILSVLTAVRSKPFVLMAHWNSPRERWVLTLHPGVLLSRRLHRTHTLRLGRLNATFVPSKKVAKPYWWILVFLCHFGATQSLHLNTFGIDFLLLHWR